MASLVIKVHKEGFKLKRNYINGNDINCNESDTLRELIDRELWEFRSSMQKYLRWWNSMVYQYKFRTLWYLIAVSMKQ